MTPEEEELQDAAAYLVSWANVAEIHRQWWNGGRKEGKPLFQSYAYLLGWSVDLLRAINERPAWAKWLLKIALGRYALRELIGLRQSIENNDWDVSFPYGLQDAKYHNDKVDL